MTDSPQFRPSFVDRHALVPSRPNGARGSLLVLIALAVAGCHGGTGAEGDDDDARVQRAPESLSEGAVHPQEAFLERLALHCDRAYEGEITSRPPEDEIFRGDERLTVHFRECAPGQLKLPFHVEDDRSRTWILTRTDSGIDLRHDHRHEDGTPDETTMYGAHTRGPGTALRQEFLRERREGAQTGWAIEVVPQERYTYGTLVDGDWRYRLDFDLSTPVPAPPPPWGHR